MSLKVRSSWSKKSSKEDVQAPEAQSAGLDQDAKAWIQEEDAMKGAAGLRAWLDRTSRSEVHKVDLASGENLLMRACAAGKVECVKILRDYWMDGSVSTADLRNRTPLFHALANNRAEVLPYLLEQPGIEASYGMRDAKYGRTPLAEACAKGNLEPAIALLSSPLFHPPVATLDEKDKMGATALWHVCNLERVTIRRPSFGSGEEIDEASTHRAASRPVELQLRVLQLLREKGASLDLPDGEEGGLPLSRAAARGYVPLIHFLLQHAPHLINAADKESRTALWHAADQSQLETVQVLIGAGADFTLRDSVFGDSPLERAARAGSEDIVKFLIEQGASYVGKEGRSTIDVAQAACKLSIVQYLAGLLRRDYKMQLDARQQDQAVGVRTWTYDDLNKATNGFTAKLGDGNFASVYLGSLPDYSFTAVKMMDLCTYQQLTADQERPTAERFFSEVATLRKLQHPNVAAFLGHCAAFDQYRVGVVTEHVPETLFHRLFPHLTPEQEMPVPLTAEERLRVAINAARGLVYLHSQTEEGVPAQPIFHRDIKVRHEADDRCCDRSEG
jgi:ankyrin repeat protein